MSRGQRTEHTIDPGSLVCYSHRTQRAKNYVLIYPWWRLSSPSKKAGEVALLLLLAPVALTAPDLLRITSAGRP